MTTARWFWMASLLWLGLPACGRTEMEWDQKVREVEALSVRVSKQNLERAKLDEDAARIQEENTALKAELAARASVSRVGEAGCVEQMRDQRMALEQLKLHADALRVRLEPLAADGLTVSLRRGQLTLTLPAAMVFEGKNADLSPRGRKSLRSVAEAVLADERLLVRFFLVSAHEIPARREEGAIARSQARAIAVRDLLTGKQGGLPPARWSAAGRGVVDPIVGDDQPDLMPRNERVEIVMLSDSSELTGRAP